MRDGKGVHAIRDSCYHRKTGVGGMAANTSKVPKMTNFKNLHQLGSYPRGGTTTAGCWGFLSFVFVVVLFCFFFWWSLTPDSRFSLGQTNICRKRPLHHLGWNLDRNIFCTLRGGRTKAGSNAPGAFLGFYPAVRTGSSN